MASEKEDRIRAKAHEIWLSEGSPEGSEGRHWEMAVAAIEAEDAAPAATPETPEAVAPETVVSEAEPTPAAPKPKAPRKRAAPKSVVEGETPAPAKRAARVKKTTPTV